MPETVVQIDPRGLATFDRLQVSADQWMAPARPDEFGSAVGGGGMLIVNALNYAGSNVAPGGLTHFFQTRASKSDYVTITTQAGPLSLAEVNLVLVTRVAELEARINLIEAVMPDVKTVVLRTLTHGEVKNEIRDLMNAGKPLFYSEIAEALSLSLSMVVDVVEELVDEGVIAPAGETATR